MRLAQAASQGALESGVFCAIRLSRGTAEVTRARAERTKAEVMLTILNNVLFLEMREYDLILGTIWKR